MQKFAQTKKSCIFELSTNYNNIFHPLILFIMSTTHYVFFDGCSHFVGSLEYDQTEDTEIVFSSTDFEECADEAERLNDICTD